MAASDLSFAATTSAAAPALPSIATCPGCRTCRCLEASAPCRPAPRERLQGDAQAIGDDLGDRGRVALPWVES